MIFSLDNMDRDAIYHVSTVVGFWLLVAKLLILPHPSSPFEDVVIHASSLKTISYNF